MITIDDLPEMLNDLAAGDLRIVDFYGLCLDLFERNEVTSVLARLPDDVRAEIDQRLGAEFDNDTPPADFIMFDSGRGDHPGKAQIVERVRTWLAGRNR